MKENLTPLMKQYDQLKSSHPDEILLFRLGDFYEMFHDDARHAAPVLEVALTQRQGVPMCGIPYHAADRYVAKLLKKGLRVSIAEQMEDPESVKGLVKREVVRTISAGTVIEENLLKEKSNNFLAAIAFEEKKSKNGNSSSACAALDISTGQILIREFESAPDFSNLRDELARIQPSEILVQDDSAGPRSLHDTAPIQKILQSEIEKIDLKAFPALKMIDSQNQPLSVQASRMILAYIQKMNPSFLSNIQPAKIAVQSDFMTLDRETIENLEILKNSLDGASEKTLLSFLDRTCTAMGGRLLKQWLVHPLVHLRKIQERLDSVEFFVQESSARKACMEMLKGVSDLERMIVRIASGHAGPRDLIGIKISLMKCMQVKAALFGQSFPRSSAFSSEAPAQIKEWISQIEDCGDLIQLLQEALADEPPIRLENGGVIRRGCDPDLDEKRKAAEEGKEWLQSLESAEKEKTGISTLKIGYTSVFGYYFEVTKPHLAKVPPAWHRKQTLVNAERYVDEELKNLESKILGAEEQSLRIEKALFEKIVARARCETGKIQRTADRIAHLDCILSLAETAELKNLAKPAIEESGEIRIADGWHPVVREALPSGRYVPNDTLLNSLDQRIVILTGPNMSGKSTYLRQTALIVLMAQIGSFVSAKEAHIALTDRIFTRIGSGDRLAQGESTFMVEMQETAKILRYATDRSLIILDEVGRGTSTYDGISIAWAVVEYLAQEIKSKVLFATHYFELTRLSGDFEGIKNYNVQAKEWQDSVIFLHKIAPGPADRSYGIHVAQLAGLPADVIQRSKKILKKLEKEHNSLLQLNCVQKESWLFPINDD